MIYRECLGDGVCVVSLLLFIEEEGLLPGDGVGVVGLLLFIGEGEVEGLLPGVLGVLGDGVGGVGEVGLLLIIGVKGVKGEVEGLLPGVLGVLGDGVLGDGELIGILYLFILWINNIYKEIF